MRLLIVDNSQNDRKQLKEILQSEGYAVEEAEDGRQALKKALQAQPDMIISEIQMPVMDGFRLCREIKSNERTCHVLFIFYTGTYTDIRDEDFAFRVGADRFFIKTGKWKEFLWEIRGAFKEKDVGEALPELSANREKGIYVLDTEQCIHTLENKAAGPKTEIEWRKEMERERYRLVFQNAPIGIYFYDKNGIIRDCNKKSQEITGGTRDQLIGLDLLKNVTNRPVRKAIEDSLAGKTGHYEGEYTSVTGGQTSYLRVDFVPIFSEKERLIGGICLAEDISLKVDAESRLRKSENKYRTILESIEDGYYEVDLKGNLVFFNKALCHIIGYPETELKGKNYRSFMDAENADKTFQVFSKVYTSGNSSKGFDWKVLRKNGAGRYLDTSVMPVRNENGKIQGFRGLARDVTERRLMEKFLVESEERYRLIFESAPVGIFHYDTNGVIRNCNQAYVDMNGSSYEKLIGFNLLEKLINKNSLAAVKKSLTGAAGRYEGEYTSVTGGRRMYIKADLVPVFSENEGLVGGMGVVENLTERKRAEQALKESEEKYRGLSERSPGIVLLADPDGVCRFISSSVERILGFSMTEIRGKRLGDIYSATEADKILSALGRVINGETVGPFEAPLFKKDGTRAVIEWEGVPVVENNRITMAQFCGRDITDRKNAEEALIKSRKQLRELSMHLQNSREQERAGIAREIHDDLGQALMAIKMDVSWLRNKINEKNGEAAKKAEDTLSMIDAAIQSVKRISSDLRPGLLDDLGLAAAIEWQARDYQKRSGITINVAIQPEDFQLPDGLSIAMFRVCQEAMTNVIRHAGATDVWVDLTKGDKGIALSVADNGIGICEKAVAQKDSFGLIGMRERVHAIGGNIRVFRMSDGGTKVAVHVPLADGDR